MVSPFYFGDMELGNSWCAPVNNLRPVNS